MKTTLNSDGTMEATVDCSDVDDSLKKFVTEKLANLQESSNKSWEWFGELIFCVDCCRMQFKKECCWMLNEIELVPLATTFAACGTKDEEIMLRVADSFKKWLDRNVNEFHG